MTAIRSPSRDWAIITGASSGIGKAFAESFAQKGVNVVMTARSGVALASIATHLEKTYEIKTLIYAADLKDYQKAEGLVQTVEDANIRIKYLVNNAGFGLRGKFTETQWDSESAMIDLNTRTLTYLCKEYARRFKDQNAGHILNVASTAAFFAGPNMAVYFATKAYVLNLSRALHEELSGSNITVTALCPGPTDTGFAESAKTAGTGFFKGGLASAEQVAEYGVRAMLRGKRIAIPGIRNKLVVFIGRLMPRRLTAKYIASRQ